MVSFSCPFDTLLTPDKLSGQDKEKVMKRNRKIFAGLAFGIGVGAMAGGATLSAYALGSSTPASKLRSSVAITGQSADGKETISCSFDGIDASAFGGQPDDSAANAKKLRSGTVGLVGKTPPGAKFVKKAAPETLTIALGSGADTQQALGSDSLTSVVGAASGTRNDTARPGSGPECAALKLEFSKMSIVPVSPEASTLIVGTASK
jgi:hypothetical protein